ncbi:MAG: hypothetical protein KDC79_17240 [Cyclobacteriaceae bacterium]|nr:hypothetical protein [Cyclobacteriaceae bacterium]
MIKNNVFRNASFTGILLIGVSVWMLVIGRSASIDGIWLPDGFKNPILALEFASGTNEISAMMESFSSELVHSLKVSTQIDMLFLLVYNSFLILVLNAIYRITRLEQYKWLSLLPLLVLLADAMENMELFNAFDGMAVNIIVLKISTWIKWLGLSLSFIAVGRFLITTGRYYDKVLALSTFVTLPLGLWAMFSHNGINEVFAMLFYLLFPMAIIYTWFSGIKRST